MTTQSGQENPPPPLERNAFLWLKVMRGLVILGQPEVKLHRNILWLSNLVKITTDQCVMYYRAQRSSRGHLGSARCRNT